MAAKPKGSLRHLRMRKRRRLLSRELKPEVQVYHKPGPPLPPPQTVLTPEGQKEIRAGKLQANVLPVDSRGVGQRPGITGFVAF